MALAVALSLHDLAQQQEQQIAVQGQHIAGLERDNAALRRQLQRGEAAAEALIGGLAQLE